MVLRRVVFLKTVPCVNNSITEFTMCLVTLYLFVLHRLYSVLEGISSFPAQQQHFPLACQYCTPQKCLRIPVKVPFILLLLWQSAFIPNGCNWIFLVCGIQDLCNNMQIFLIRFCVYVHCFVCTECLEQCEVCETTFSNHFVYHSSDWSNWHSFNHY